MYSLWNKIMWGGEPDEVNVVTGLSRRDVYKIKTSWAVMYADAEKYGMELFFGLFRLNPETKTFFKTIRHLSEEEIKQSVQFRAHVINLMTSLHTAVMHLHQPELVIALMNKLGETHKKRRVETKHFNQLKEVLANILTNQMNANEELVASWVRFVNFIYRHIFDKL
ncbi:globin-2 A chain-like [Ostrinia furnacalis]|uniref:globin-2 A chain-like n=1 Tax=Ostrinia furnacalis TaxID=93504 RepID=UPI00103C4CD8|nr:globin-2 A chain-like [Ostrinia furnacalis]